MPPPRTLSPTEALETIASRLEPAPLRPVSLERARGKVLAERILSLPPGSGFPGDPPHRRRARSDGYLLSGPVRPGDTLGVEGPLSGEREPQPEELLAEAPLPPPGRTRRVECGNPVPAASHAVLVPGAAVLVSGGRVRVERAPEPGEGLTGAAEGPAAAWEPGEVVDGRLQAFLAATGRSTVGVREPPRAGILLVGDELVDLAPERVPGLSGVARQDLTGGWLAAALEVLGVETVALGIASRRPEEILRALARARELRLGLFVVAGGLGEGVRDRTAEALCRGGARIFFERVDLEGCPVFLCAKTASMDVLGLSGEPLAAAAGFDLFAAPGLAAARGLPAARWDWRRRLLPLAAPLPPTGGSRRWRLVGAAELPGPAGPRLRVWTPESPFSPAVAGASGWAVVSSGGAGEAWYQPRAG